MRARERAIRSRPWIACLKDQRGASALEFALVVSLLLLLVFGIVQFGMAWHTKQGLQAAAREGARIASLPGATLDEVATRAGESLSLIDAADVSCPSPDVGEYCVEITPSINVPCLDRSGEEVAVEVSSKVQIAIPLWESPELDLSGRGVYRCE